MGVSRRAKLQETGRKLSEKGEATEAYFGIVVNTDTDWYALAVSNNLELLEVMEEPKFTVGQKLEYTTWIDPTNGGEPKLGDFPTAFVWRMNKPTNDTTNVQVELKIRVRPLTAKDTISFRVGKGWAGRSVTHFYDANGKMIFSHQTRPWGDGGDWNDPPFSLPFTRLLP